MLYEVSETGIIIYPEDLHKATPGCTIDPTFGEQYLSMEEIEVYERRKDAEFDMNHDIKYANAIIINEETVTIYETHLHEVVDENDCGYEWEYQADYTCVILRGEEDYWHEFPTFEKAKQFAIEHMEVTA